MTFIIFLMFVPLLLWAFSSFDDLIRLEYENFQYFWIQDKQPIGMRWRPENYPRNFRGGKGSQIFWFLWLFKTPEWVKKSEQGAKLLKRYRILVLTWNVLFFPLFFIALRFSQ